MGKIAVYACYEESEIGEDLLAMFMDEDEAVTYCDECTYNAGIDANVRYYYEVIRVEVLG